jgi:hypothetical protein
MTDRRAPAKTAASWVRTSAFLALSLPLAIALVVFVASVLFPHLGPTSGGPCDMSGVALGPLLLLLAFLAYVPPFVANLVGTTLGLRAAWCGRPAGLVTAAANVLPWAVIAGACLR